MKKFFQKYLENRCEEDEFNLFVDLITKQGNEKELSTNMQEDWNTMPLYDEAPDLSDTLHQIHYRINSQEVPVPRSRKMMAYLVRVAAVLFIPLAVTYFLQVYKGRNVPAVYQTVSTPLASKTSFQLPDGSTVWLNSGSSLRFPAKFVGGKRLVELTGEAYFDVAKNGDPFTVKTSRFDVNVMGTAFDVMAYRNEIPVVTLERGKVMLETRSGARDFLTPGEQAHIDTLQESITLSKVDTRIFSAWIHDRLIFQNEPLSAVVKRLERWYNVDIHVDDPSLMDLRLTANIEFESIREIMELMEITLPVKYAYNKDARKLTIYRKSTNTNK